MKRTLCVLFFVFLGGCAGTINPEQFVGPNGKSAYAMDCAGMSKTVAGCYKKAGEICPSGYNVISQSAAPIGIPGKYGTLIVSDDKMAIECK